MQFTNCTRIFNDLQRKNTTTPLYSKIFHGKDQKKSAGAMLLLPVSVVLVLTILSGEGLVV